MTAIIVKRTIIRRTRAQRSATRQSLRELSRSYLAGERTVEFTIEALLFAIIVAISSVAGFSSRKRTRRIPSAGVNLSFGCSRHQ